MFRLIYCSIINVGIVFYDFYFSNSFQLSLRSGFSILRRMLWKSPPESCCIDFSRFLPDKSWNLSEMIFRSVSLRDTNTLIIVSSSQSEPSQDKMMNFDMEEF